MTDAFNAPISLGLDHVQAIVQGMVVVANSDACHDEELVLIREFYESCRAEVAGLADFADLIRRPFNASEARDVLDREDLQVVLLKSCYLVAFADGHLSPAEKTAIAGLVSQLGIPETVATHVRELVKDELLSQIARSHQVETLRKIAAELDA